MTEFDYVMIKNFMDRLHSLGCAVVVFDPDELAGADIGKIESRMIEKGWEIIESGE